MGIKKKINDINRFWEIDALRGTAIVMMIIFHFFVDLDFLGISQREMFQGGWLVFQRTIAFLFLSVVGISLDVSFQRLVREKTSKIILKYFKQGLTVFGAGMLVSIATFIYPREGFIIFGILHLIGLSVILCIPLLFLNFIKFNSGFKFPNIFNLIIGLIILFIGYFIDKMIISTKLFIWLGLKFPGFYTLDYFPVFPWLGIVIIGIFLGRFAVEKNIFGRVQKIKIKQISILNPLCFLGKHSLIIYLIHQPIIVGIILLLLKLNMI